MRCRIKLLLVALLTVVVAGASIAVLLGGRLYAALRQREAVNVIRQAGGRVCYERPSLSSDLFGTILRPFGSDFFCPVVTVELEKSSFSDADSCVLQYLPRAEILDLTDTNVTDAALPFIAGMRDLNFLLLVHARVSDCGICSLPTFEDLEFLYLNDTRVGDESIAWIRKLPMLRHLELQGTRVTDQGLIQLSGLRTLQVLDVCETNVTAVGVRAFQRSLPNTEIRVSVRTILEAQRDGANVSDKTPLKGM